MLLTALRTQNGKAVFQKEREDKRDHRQERNLTRILASVIGEKEKDKI